MIARDITQMLSRSGDPDGARLVEMIGQLEAANRLMGAGHYVAAAECCYRVQSMVREMVPAHDADEVRRRANVLADSVVGQSFNPTPFDLVRRGFGQ